MELASSTVRPTEHAVTTMTMVQALNQAMRLTMESDPKVLVMGEDVGRLGGVFRVTAGLQKDFGDQRVVDTPLAESGIVGTAIGLAMQGHRPVCEIQFDGFVYPAFDQIVSQLAKYRYRTGGAVSLPVTIRIPYGGGIGAIEHHSESPEAYFAHTAGLKVVSPSTPADAHHMLRAAIASDDPVIFLEPKRAYWDKGEVAPEATGLPLHQARVVRPGTDSTLLAWGPTVKTCVAAALAADLEQRSLEVVDLRSLSPIDLPTVLESVRRTRRLVVVHEAARQGGLGGEIAAQVMQDLFYDLEAPVLRVTGYDTPYPPSRVEDDYLPDLDRVLAAVDQALGH